MRPIATRSAIVLACLAALALWPQRLDATCGGGGGGGNGGGVRGGGGVSVKPPVSTPPSTARPQPAPVKPAPAKPAPAKPAAPLYRPVFTDSAAAAKKAEDGATGIVYCIEKDKPIDIWSKALADASAKIPFVLLAGKAGDDLAHRAEITLFPAMVMTDRFGNIVWIFTAELDRVQIEHAVAAIGATVKAFAEKQPKNLDAARALAADPEQRPRAVHALRKLVDLKGYPEISDAAKPLLDGLVAQGQQELDDAAKLGDADARRAALEDVRRRYPDTAIADQAKAALKAR